jgi:chromate transporter
MIAVVKETVVDKFGWLTEDEFMEVIAIAESTPGPIAINMATFVGYKKAGVLGSALATAGVVTPSLVSFISSLCSWSPLWPTNTWPTPLWASVAPWRS